MNRRSQPEPKPALSPSMVEVVDEEILYEGPRFKLARVTEKHGDGELHTRDVVRHPGAAVILAVTAAGEVVLVEQHRAALGRTLLELPAGTLEAGEDPLLGAQRELAEETGYTASHWRELVGFHPAPGLADELMTVFLATGLEKGDPNPDAGECLTIHELGIDELKQHLLTNEIVDGKTLAALLYVMFVGMETEEAQ